MFKDYYKILNIRQSATQEEIKTAFRNLAKQYHPDKNNSPNANEQFRELFEAYEILRDNFTRNEYDKLYDSFKTQHKTDFPMEFVKTYEKKQNSAKVQADFFSNMKYNDFVNSVLFGAKFFIKRLPKLIVIGLLLIIGIIGFMQFAVLMTDYEYKGVFLLVPLLSISFIAIAISDANKIFKEYQRQNLSSTNRPVPSNAL